MDHRKKIALLTDKFTVGGGLEIIYQIARGFPKIEFGIFAKKGEIGNKFQHLENVRLFPTGYNPKSVLDFQPDLIHIHHTKPLFRIFLDPFRKYRIPIIFTAHGMHIHKYKFRKGIRNRINYYLRLKLEKYLCNRVDKVVAVSEEDLNFLKTKYQLDACILIRNGIDVNKITTSNTSKVELRKKLDLPVDYTVFLTVARFNFQKGYDILIEAIAKISEEIKNKKIRFLLAGDGGLFNFMKQLATEASLSGQVIFLGKRDDIYDLMMASDFFILPSRWEGLPISLLEASYCRLPIIASDTYGNHEIVAHGKNGLLFRNSDPHSLSSLILDAIQDKFHPAELAEEAYRQVLEKYTLTEMITNLRQLYSEYLFEFV